MKEGLIEALRREPRQGRPRVVYGITAKGLDEAEKARAEMRLVMGEVVAGGGVGSSKVGSQPTPKSATSLGTAPPKLGSQPHRQTPAPPERFVVRDEEEGG